MSFFISSLGSKNVHSTKPLVPLIALSYDHQNHSKWHKWCHVHYNLPLFGDWWQHNQSKHKICKNWQIESLTLTWMLTTIQWWLGLPLKPWCPFVPPPICYSSLICWLDPLGMSPPLEHKIKPNGCMWMQVGGVCIQMIGRYISKDNVYT